MEPLVYFTGKGYDTFNGKYRQNDGFHTHSRHEAVVQVFIRKQNSIFDEDSARSQDEGEEQVDVDVVPGAVELPDGREKLCSDFLRRKYL